MNEWFYVSAWLWIILSIFIHRTYLIVDKEAKEDVFYSFVAVFLIGPIVLTTIVIKTSFFPKRR